MEGDLCSLEKKKHLAAKLFQSIAGCEIVVIKILSSHCKSA